RRAGAARTRLPLRGAATNAGRQRSGARERLEPRAGSRDRCTGVGGELLEVLAEHPGQLARLAVVRLGLAPGRAWIEQPRDDAGDLDRNLEAEDVVGAGLRVLQLAGQRRAQERARLGD